MIRTCDVQPGGRPGHRRPGHVADDCPPAGPGRDAGPPAAPAARRPVRKWSRWRPPLVAGTGRRLGREALLVAAFAVIYEEIGKHMVQAGAAASAHALLIVDAERALGLFREQGVQAAIIKSDNVTDTFNAYYGGTHFLIPALVLAWLFLWHPAHYARARTALAVSTAVAFVCFWVYPVAPPRLLPARFGIIDTLVAPDGSGHFDNTLLNSAGDKYASMPSLHVAWAVWCALALYPVMRHWALRVVAIAYPFMTTLVVVATGNHYFLDAIAGTLLAWATWAAVTRAGAWLTVAAATRGGHRELDPSRPADFLLPADWPYPADWLRSVNRILPLAGLRARVRPARARGPATASRAPLTGRLPALGPPALGPPALGPPAFGPLRPAGMAAADGAGGDQPPAVSLPQLAPRLLKP
ncbi:MAG TPA: phosphatase PAP2 family protein [Trebonia sp.]|jgi:hypothetical protein|nr:phosphatase PAP2 family protein [Trebonia sp.]